MLHNVKSRFCQLPSLISVISSVFLLSSLSSTMKVWADAKDGAATFQAKCSACHSIGKGQLVGPDLAKGKSWTEDNLEASITRMEATVGPLSPAEKGSLMDFLKYPESAGDLSAASPPAKVETAATAAAEITEEVSAIELGSLEEGSQLFDGRRSFSKGGMSCNACHSVDGSGSTMGPDLKNISSKLNNAALLAACQQTPFKVMKAAYGDHPLSKQEALSLVKYLESVKDQTPGGKGLSVMMAGTCGSIFILAIVAFAYRNRNTGVRKKLQRRQ